jgi:hypothetical protein
MTSKPEPTGPASVFGTLASAFGIVLVVATILAITAVADPTLYPIFRPQFLVLY